jgi:phage baseplate assembly protein W
MLKRQLSNPVPKIISKDFDLMFRRHPSTGKLLVKKGDDSIKQGLRNLILTDRYERPFRPEFGGDVRRRLFDNFASISSLDYGIQIETAIGNYEPRAILDPYSVRVAASPDQNKLAITITFRSAISLNDSTIDVNLNRVR